jgi:hypothetical protein
MSFLHTILFIGTYQKQFQEHNKAFKYSVHIYESLDKSSIPITIRWLFTCNASNPPKSSIYFIHCPLCIHFYLHSLSFIPSPPSETIQYLLHPHFPCFVYLFSSLHQQITTDNRRDRLLYPTHSLSIGYRIAIG